MSNRQTILLALQKHGESTYDDLEHSTGLPRNELRIAINDAKKADHVAAGKDVTTNSPNYSITPAGIAWLKSRGAESKGEAAAEKKTKQPAQTIESRAVEIAVDRHNKVAQLQEQLDQLRQQIKLAEQQRDTHFTAAEDYKGQLEIAEQAAHAWIALAKEYGCNSIPELSSFIERNRAEGSTVDAVDVKDAAIGYIVRVPKRKLILRNTPDGARSAALSGARAHGRADVLALVPVGKAVRGAEWKAA